MKCQRDLFTLSPTTTFLNGAYMSPLLRSSEKAGILGLQRKRMPSDLRKEDFFDDVNDIRSLFNELINGSQPNRVVVAPSASYLIASVAQNVNLTKGCRIVVLANQFPSNYYVWNRLAEEHGAQILSVQKPKDKNLSWTTALVSAIDEKTSVVSISALHWEDGTLLDMQAVSRKCKTVGATLIIDGTQSIGALPFDQAAIQADAIITSSYKWLLGPYGSAIGYFGPTFDLGNPIEESWLNRLNSDDFQYLTNYQNQYRTGARRYEVGEAPDFIKMPMMKESLTQLLKWNPSEVQAYCKSIVHPILEPLNSAGFTFNKKEEMAYHLFGIGLPERLNLENVKLELARQKISVSYRQNIIRVSPNVYNTKQELEKLKNVLLSL